MRAEPIPVPATSGLVTARSRWLGPDHPLAGVAADRCRRTHGARRAGVGVGRVACGACWEHAIRTDAHVAAEHGLPPVPESDPQLVDEIAVERAVAGDLVVLARLTPVERDAAAAWLRAAGPVAVERLRPLGARVVRAVLGLLTTPTPDPATTTTATAADGSGVAA